RRDQVGLAARRPDRPGPQRHRKGSGARGSERPGQGQDLMEAASIAQVDHHGPPPAHRSSRVHAPTLGMLLFIISEVMIFGAFFTAYFFIRVVSHDPWPEAGTKRPQGVAGINTAILLSSSLTLHWALTSIKRGNRFGLKAGMTATFLLGVTFLCVQ